MVISLYSSRFSKGLGGIEGELQELKLKLQQGQQHGLVEAFHVGFVIEPMIARCSPATELLTLLGDVV
ncbi:hypothetical protein L2E82_25507 [Cichorium intybus]|uniref:Uncharacterized protein n=1 Tax=Cichorium intybus TaxID=13427 RepID=A0ACB9E3G2_CICIN|nr:hypothetical protein L2E82_25507 [Cichorium intybus]